MNNKKRVRHMHPIYLSSKLKISAFLLVLPLVREILIRPDGIIGIIAAAGLNTLYSAAVISWTIISYRRFFWRSARDGIRISSGLLRRKWYTVPYDRMRCITFRKGPLSRLLGAVWVSFDTAGKLPFRTDISICLDRRGARSVLGHFSGSKCRAVKYSAKRIMLTALLGSNPFSGLLLIVPAVYETGRIFGISPYGLIGLADSFPLIAADYLSPTARIAAKLMIAGWTASAAIAFFRYFGHRVTGNGASIVARRGLLTKIITVTDRTGISALSFDSTLTTALSGLSSVSIFSVGSGKLRGDRRMLLPLDRRSSGMRNAEMLTGLDLSEEIRADVSPRAVLSYTLAPLLSALMSTSVVLASSLLTGMSFYTTGLLLTIPFAWWCIFRIYACRSSFFATGKDCAVLCSCSGLTLRQLHIPYPAITGITVSQSIFQKRRGLCSISVSVFSEKRESFMIKGLLLREAEPIVSEILKNSTANNKKGNTI